jgi:hypothetical protein
MPPATSIPGTPPPSSRLPSRRTTGATAAPPRPRGRARGHLPELAPARRGLTAGRARLWAQVSLHCGRIRPVRVSVEAPPGDGPPRARLRHAREPRGLAPARHARARTCALGPRDCSNAALSRFIPPYFLALPLRIHLPYQTPSSTPPLEILAAGCFILFHPAVFGCAPLTPAPRPGHPAPPRPRPRWVCLAAAAAAAATAAAAAAACAPRRTDAVARPWGSSICA